MPSPRGWPRGPRPSRPPDPRPPWSNDLVTALFVLLCVGIIAGVALVAAGRLDRLPDAEPDRRPPGSGPAFDVVPRGYRMDEVDAVVTALMAENASLRARAAGRPPTAGG